MKKVTKRLTLAILSLAIVFGCVFGINAYVQAGVDEDWEQGYYEETTGYGGNRVTHRFVVNRNDCTAEVGCNYASTARYSSHRNCGTHQFYEEHDLEVQSVVEPTCTTGGYTVYKCTRCAHTETGNEVPALGHDFPDQTVCTGETVTCQNEGCDEEHTYPAGHVFETEVETVDPTCTEHGYTTYKCDYCDVEEGEERDTVPALGHTFAANTSCDATTATCTRCNETVTHDVSAHSYSSNAEIKDSTSHYVTCTECGHTETETHTYGSAEPYGCQNHKRTCTKCGHVTYEAHQWENKSEWRWAVVIPYNHEYRQCKICGQRDDVDDDELHHYVFDPTATITYDNHGVICTDCNKKTTEGHKGLKSGEDGNCTVCGVHQYCNNGCTHRYILRNDDCTITVECLAVATGECGEPDVTYNRGFHEYVYDNITTTTHDKHCAYCTTPSVTEQHVYDQPGDKCVCGKEKPVCQHEYEYTDLKDGEHHHYECKKCHIDGDALHTWNAGVHHAATCTDAEYTLYTCTACEATKTVYGEAALGHVPVTVSGYAATCTTPGLTDGTRCSRCNSVLTAQEEIPATDHNWSVWTTTVTPECEKAGKEERHCQNAGCIEHEEHELPALVHDYQKVSGTDKYEELGYHKHNHSWTKKCSLCNDEKETTPIEEDCSMKQEGDSYYFNLGEDGHYLLTNTRCELCGYFHQISGDVESHKFGEWIIDTDSTCTQTGTKHRVCEDCKYVENGIVEKKAHEFTVKVDGSDTYVQVTGSNKHMHGWTNKCAHCEETEIQEAVSEDCEMIRQGDGFWTTSENGHHFDYNTKCVCGREGIEEGQFAEHNFGEWIIDTDSTCTQTGTKHRVCVDCEYVENGTVDKKDHTHKDEDWEVVTPATCTVDGLEQNYCSECDGDRITRVIPHPGHDFETVPEVPATCTELGVSEYKQCKNCEYNEGKTILDIIPHSYEDKDGLAATCTTDGYTNYKECSVCHHIEGKEKLDKLDHDFTAHKVGSDLRELIENNDEQHNHSWIIKCLRCEEELKDRHVELEAHRWDDGVITDPTCTSEGYTTFTCLDCGYVWETEKVSATGHNHSGAWVVDTKATNTADGAKHRVCANDNCEEILDNTVIPKAGFTMSNEQVTYDGESHSIEVVRSNYDSDATITYTIYKDGNVAREAKDAGVYTVKANVSATDEYEAFELEATLTINKKQLSINDFANILGSINAEKDYDENNKVYFDGEETLTSSMTFGEDTVPYTVTGTYSDYKPGNKDVTLTIKVDSNNYELNDTYNAKGSINTLTFNNTFDKAELIYTKDNSEIENAIKQKIGTKKSTFGTFETGSMYEIKTVVITYDADKKCEEVDETAKAVYTYALKDGTVVATQNFNGSLQRHHKAANYSYLDSTCTEDGHEGGTYCEICQSELTPWTVIPAKGHDYQYVAESDEYTIIEGNEEVHTHTWSKKCSRCEDVITAADEKHAAECSEQQAHTFEWVPGSDRYDYNKNEQLDTHTHSWKEKCSLCEMVVDRHEECEHKFNTNEVVNPTCLDDGYTVIECEDCHEIRHINPTNALGHQLDEERTWTETKAPTCTEEGEEESYCDRCEEDHKTRPVSALGHSYGNEYVYLQATNTESGTYAKDCTRAGCKHIERTTEIPAAGITVTGDRQVVYDGKAHNLAGSKDGFIKLITKDNEAVSEAVNAGEYNFKFTYAENDEYKEIILEDTLKVLPATITIPADLLAELQLDADSLKTFDNTADVLFDGKTEKTVTVQDEAGNDVEIKVTGKFNDKFPGIKGTVLFLEIQDGNHLFDNNESGKTIEGQGTIEKVEFKDTFADIDMPRGTTDDASVIKEIEKAINGYKDDFEKLGFNGLEIKEPTYELAKFESYGTKHAEKVVIVATMKNLDNGEEIEVARKEITGNVTYNKSKSRKPKKEDPDDEIEIEDDEIARGLDFEYIDLPKNEVTPSDWAKDDIYDLTYQGIVNGYEDLTYRPNNRIRRDEFSKLAYLILGLKEDPNGRAKEFEDTVDNWAKDMIREATTVDVLRGYDDRFFGPADNITNEQMMAILVRGLRYLGEDVRITDDAEADKELAKVIDGAEVSDWAKLDAATAVKYGLFQGDENKAIKPLGYTTRAQVAVIIKRYQKVIADLVK